MEPVLSRKLLGRVAGRLKLRACGRAVYVSLLAASGLYVLALLASRLLGVVPAWFSAQTLLLIPAAALVPAVFMYRRPGPEAAARAVDRWAGTKDLYLTLMLLDRSPGEFGILVVRDAERKAASIKSRHVVDFPWQRPVFRMVVVGLLLFLGVLNVPQFDPFGKVEAAQETAVQQQQLAAAKQRTLTRMAELKRDKSDAEISEDVKQAVEDLKKAFNSMKPRQPQENLQVLSKQQGFFSEKWQKLTAESLKNLLDRSAMNQRFGAADQQEFEKWSRELAEGNAESLQQELETMRKTLDALRAATDPMQKEQLKRDLEKRLQKLAEFAEDQANARALSAALKQAMRELSLDKLDQLSEEAREALQMSLELSQLELEELAKSARDLKTLEEALKAMQLAKQLNAEGNLDGEACENCIGLADYAELYAQLMEQMAGQGDGLGNEGQGRGGIAPEDDSIETGFRTEQSKSAVTAGKVLLSTKTKGLGEQGEAKLEYRNLVRAVKQGVSEAILQEQIPPGYHEGIKGYFDSIETDREPAADAQP